MNSSGNTALEKLLRPLRRDLSAELAGALIALRADSDTQARYEELADKRTAGSLSPTEMNELEAMVRANTLLGLIQTEAHAILAHTKAA